jgi:hypothetical protein
MASEAPSIAARLALDPELRALVEAELVRLGRRLSGPDAETSCEEHHLPWFACIDLCNSWEYVMAVLAVLVVMSAIIDATIEALSRTEGVAGVLFEKVLKELTILGLLSFTLFAVAANGVPEALKESLELVHMTLFVAAIFYLVFVAALVHIQRRLLHKWRADGLTLSKMSTGQRDELSTLTQGSCIGNFIGFWLCLPGRRRRVHRRMMYQQLLTLEIVAAKYASAGLNLGRFATADDGYIAYLRHCSTDLLIRFAELTPSAWMACIGLYAITWGGGQLVAAYSNKELSKHIKWGGDEGTPLPLCAAAYEISCGVDGDPDNCTGTGPSNPSEYNTPLAWCFVALCWVLTISSILLTRCGLGPVIERLSAHAHQGGTATRARLLREGEGEGGAPSDGAENTDHTGTGAGVAVGSTSPPRKASWLRRRMPCCFSPLDAYRAQFWFHSPHFFVRAFQSMLLSQALYSALFVLVWAWSVDFWTLPALAAPPVYFCALFSYYYVHGLTLAWAAGPLCGDGPIKAHIRRCEGERGAHEHAEAVREHHGPPPDP